MATFVDSGQILDDFKDIIYVRCPNCGQCAPVMFNNKAGIGADLPNASANKQSRRPVIRYRNQSDARKLSCLHCAYTKVLPAGTYYVPQSLWLQTSCGCETLWALNREHLDFIAQYVEAKLRSKSSRLLPYRNKTLASRLPFWMKSAKNRYEVLKGIRRLYKLAESM